MPQADGFDSQPGKMRSLRGDQGVQLIKKLSEQLLLTSSLLISERASRYWCKQDVRLLHHASPLSGMSCVQQGIEACLIERSLRHVSWLTAQRPHKRVRPGYRCWASSIESPSTSPGSLEGVWIRDNNASDLRAYDRMLGIMQLSGLQRTTALNLIEGIEFKETATGLLLQFLTVVPFFKVTEEVDFVKKTTTQARRDLRPGKQIARAAIIPYGFYVEMSWGEPLPGRLSETYVTRGDSLQVESEVNMQGARGLTQVVYRRRTEWRPKFSFPPGLNLQGSSRAP